MARLAPVATTIQTTEVKLSTRARQMVKQRCEEHAVCARQVAELKGTKKRPGRMKRIEQEIDAVFTKERQGKALLDGTSIDQFKLKMVLGKRKVFDQLGFMKKHGVSQQDFDDFTTYEDNEPYIKISGPGDSNDE